MALRLLSISLALGVVALVAWLLLTRRDGPISRAGPTGGTRAVAESDASREASPAEPPAARALAPRMSPAPAGESSGTAGPTTKAATSPVTVPPAAAGDDLGEVKPPGAPTEPPEVVADLEEIILSGPNPRRRLWALHRLATLEGQAAEDAIVRVARDPSLEVELRREAVLLLRARLGEAQVVHILLILLADPQADIRLGAVQALGKPQHEGGLDALISVVLGDPSPGVQRAALQAIGRIGTAEAAHTLLGFLEQGMALLTDNREAILRAVGGITQPEAIPVLQDTLVRSTDRPLRRALLATLAEMADPGLFELFDETLARDSDPEARAQAAQGLGLIGDPRAIPALQAQAAKGDERERSYATTAIRRIEEARR